MSREPNLPYGTRKEVLQRDGYHCIKCGAIGELEIHHIIPVYKGGNDLDGNLITLCHYCHREAPNEPIDFLMYCMEHLPADLAKSKTVTKSVVNGILYKFQLAPEPEKQVEIYEYIDQYFDYFWKALVSRDVDYIAKICQISVPKPTITEQIMGKPETNLKGEPQ
jgi:hypothetical protein